MNLCIWGLSPMRGWIPGPWNHNLSEKADSVYTDNGIVVWFDGGVEEADPLTLWRIRKDPK